MAKLTDLVRFLDTTLQLEKFEDASLNGLQIEGAADVEKIAVAVDAGLAVVEEAVAVKAQFLLVHHGLIWEKPFPITGPAQKLVKAALGQGLSLYAAHLPLDAHPDFGNNFPLARLLGLKNLRPACKYHGQEIGCVGENPQGRSLQDFKNVLLSQPGAGSEVFCLEFGPKKPEQVAVVSGGGADALKLVEDEGFDTLITGEPKQFAYHYARERGLNVLCGGHYATETLGVRELGRVLEGEFKVSSMFIDFPTGI